MNMFKKILKSIGPGFVTGASDDDPSGIATYSQTGAQFGYNQLWLSFFSFPFMTVIQEMCGRIGLVSGKGLAKLIKDHYPKPLLYLVVSLLSIANIVNIGANLGAMASCAQILTHLDFIVLLVFFTGFSILLEVFIPYRSYSRYLKYLGFSLLAYIAVAFTLKLDWLELTQYLWPKLSFNKDYLMNVVAILGTTISPYLFFWQTSEEVENLVKQNKLQDMNVGRPDINKEDIHAERTDTIIGMLFSQVVMFFIMVTTASMLHKNHIYHVETAVQAAEALKPIAGAYASILFSAGIIGTGLLSVPVLAGSASYALSETFGLKPGLYKKPPDAKGFYGIIALATLIGVITNFTGIPPFKMLYYTAVLNGLCAPVLMAIIILIGNNAQIMGPHINSAPCRILGWLITGIMGLSGILLIISFGS